VRKHVGNKQYHRMVNEKKKRYNLSSKRSAKRSICCEVVLAIYDMDPPGRFLEKNEDTNLYDDIGEERALLKVQQSLREGAPQIRKAAEADAEADHEARQRKKIRAVADGIDRPSDLLPHVVPSPRGQSPGRVVEPPPTSSFPRMPLPEYRNALGVPLSHDEIKEMKGKK